MLDDQAAEVQRFKNELTKLHAENVQLKPALKETQESLIALDNYTRRENLRFMNIPDCAGENFQDIIYDIIENDLKINTD